MDYLVKQLSEQEKEQLVELTQHREWSYLTKLLKECEDEAKNIAVNFNTPQEAFKRQGYFEGVRMLVYMITNLYGTIKGQEISSKQPEWEGLDLKGDYDY